MGHPALSLTESQKKLRKQHDQNFSMEGLQNIVEQRIASEEINKPKEQNCDSHSQGSESEIQSSE